ncbi:FKBP-type peptidyl-prolyl cis-trans isomerase N-terminal domain-containing protein, partial [Pseudomonas syringae pv. tagetis]|uniref:FKBP-type peptidyl-prolyl cis-trans isomerase N-terminal domain-containing protein n=1 Tax=Pseudomonas syringae group genomosp. 7 TaxID=251699 RepID=UPI003770016D
VRIALAAGADLFRSFSQAAGAGKAYLAENAKREGVTTQASGLQFEVLTAGNAAKPGREDQVRVLYHGTLIDGNVFD